MDKLLEVLYDQDSWRGACELSYALHHFEESIPDMETDEERKVLANLASELIPIVELVDRYKEIEQRCKDEIREKIEMANDDILCEELGIDTEYLAAFDSDKAEHRKSRKAKRKAKMKRRSVLSKGTRQYGKKMLHRYNRRNWNEPESSYYKNNYSYNDIWWSIS